MDKQLFRYKGITLQMFIVGLLTLLQAVTIILQAIFLAKAITNMFIGTALSAVLPYFFGFALVFIMRNLLQWVKERLSFRFAEKTAFLLQTELIEKLFALGPRGIGKNGSGNMITLALEGVPNFRTYLELFIPRSLAIFVIPITIVIYIFTKDTLSGLVLIITMPLLIGFLILLGLVAKKHTNAQWGTYQVLSRHFVDSLRGLVTLKYLGKSKSHVVAIERVSDKYRIATNRSLRVAFLSTFSLDFFSSLSVAVVAVELGLRLINGVIGLESALMILILAPEYFQTVRDLGNDYHATMDGKDAGNQIQRILARATDAKEHENVQIPRWTETSSLAVTDLTMQAVENDKLILNNLSFHVTGFQKIGIIGASGAGKSTLIDLISGFSKPTRAKIEVDNVASTHFMNESWQEQITYIPQHPYIFSGTVAENIRLYAPNAANAEIETAIKMTGLSELVARFPAGLEEKIGQGGRALSGGEEQRIALTRSLLQNRPIMLFDEPTAHLDIETEHEIKEMILPHLENKFVFFATHRLHWMREMDVIFVLEHGRIVETGVHDELVKKKGAYYRLIQAQKGGVTE